MAAVLLRMTGLDAFDADAQVRDAPRPESRAIFFRMGSPIGADTSQADGTPDLRATSESDLHLIRIGTER
jgi:hypothetical protein